jgi:tetratricopeptide (TPR) repeat protein
MPEKFTRKELRGPDAFQRAGLEAREWLHNRQRLVALGAAAILLGGAGVALASYVSSRGEHQASKALGLALKNVEQPVASQPPPATAGEPEPPFGSQAAKDEAIVKSLSEIRQKYPRSRAAATAALAIGEAQLRLEKPDQALSSIEEYLKAVPPEEPLRAEALEAKGYAFEVKGQLDDALAAFDQLVRDNRSEFMNGMGLYHRARILILQNKKQEAADVLAQISLAYPDSSAARLASDRLGQLANEGVKPKPSTPAASAADAG